MKTTKIIIKNLFGIKEAALDGRSVELSGPKGSGKTSVLDAIRYALTNRSDREYIIHQGDPLPYRLRLGHELDSGAVRGDP